MGSHLDAGIASALLDSEEVGVCSQAVDHMVGDILPRTPRHVVYDGGTLIQHRVKVRRQALLRCFAVVRVYLERCVHAHLRRGEGGGTFREFDPSIHPSIPLADCARWVVATFATGTEWYGAMNVFYNKKGWFCGLPVDDIFGASLAGLRLKVIYLCN